MGGSWGSGRSCSEILVASGCLWGDEALCSAQNLLVGGYPGKPQCKEPHAGSSSREQGALPLSSRAQQPLEHSRRWLQTEHSSSWVGKQRASSSWAALKEISSMWGGGRCLGRCFPTILMPMQRYHIQTQLHLCFFLLFVLTTYLYSDPDREISSCSTNVRYMNSVSNVNDSNNKIIKLCHEL